MPQALLPVALALFAQTSQPADREPFTAARFREHAVYLAADALEGRRAGSESGAKAADYIARKFQAGGMLPLGDGRTYFQAFSLGGGVRARNVLAINPGAGQLANQCVIVSAHYDHIGRRPDAEGDETSDRIFNGADDNASGVAALLLIARALAQDHDHLPASRRSVILAGFDAEELGLRGSAYYAEHPPRPLDGTTLILNFDMVGRLQNDRLYANDAESSVELARAIRARAKECGLSVETHSAARGTATRRSSSLARSPARIS